MSIQNIISSNQLTTTANKGQTSLDKDAFLTLMLQQMRYQDPLQPMDNQAMLSQMAQFSSLEQMSNLNDNLSKANATQSLMDATRLLGKEVTIQQNGKLINGKVTAVNFSSDGPLLTIDQSVVASIDMILAVSQPASTEG